VGARAGLTSTGANANVTGSSNTFIGYNSGPGTSTQLSNATAIGANALVSANNALVLGDGAVSVGIGTTTPSYKLQVLDSSNTGLRVQTNTSGGTVASFASNGKFEVDAPFFPGGRFQVLENGNVGIGVVGVTDKLQVNGDIRVGTGTTGCVKDADATVIAGTCSSDARLKRNIRPFDPVIEKLTQLQPVYFDWRSDEFPELNLFHRQALA
jgi:endosialidase-like protein